MHQLRAAVRPRPEAGPGRGLRRGQPNTPGRLPQVAAPWSDADASCKKAGKRLCSEEEWEKACKGPEAARFPYGMSFDANACNTQDARDNPRQMAVVGSFGKVKGGHSARPGFDDRCASRRKLPLGQHDIKVGFRCCADAG